MPLLFYHSHSLSNTRFYQTLGSVGALYGYFYDTTDKANVFYVYVQHHASIIIGYKNIL